MCHRTDSILFRFLEQYLHRLEGPLAIQVWSRYVQLAKEILGSSRDFKACNFPALRFGVFSCIFVRKSNAMQVFGNFGG